MTACFLQNILGLSEFNWTKYDVHLDKNFQCSPMFQPH